MGKLDSFEAEDVALNFAALLRAVLRAWFRILLFVFLAAAGAYAFVNVQAPVYQSETRILIENRQSTFAKPQGERAQSDSDSLLSNEAVASQVEIISSRDLARKVIKQFDLGKLPEFDPVMKGISPLKSILVSLGVARDPLMMSAEERVLERFFERLIVYRIEKSRVIVVEFKSEDSELSAKVANAVADQYLTWQKAAKAENTRGASEWLAGEIKVLRKRVSEAEAKVERFRSGSDLLIGQNNTTLNTQQLSELNSQLTRLRGEKTEARAKADQIRRILASGSSLDSVNEVMNSPVIQRLQGQLATQRGKIAELSITLLPGHPRIKELNAQLTALEGQIRKEAGRVARGLENEANLATAREESIAKELATLKAAASRANEQGVDLRALDREAKAQRDLLESFLARYREAAARESAKDLPADARVISRATAPSEPSYPKKLPTIVAAIVAALILSILVVLTKALLSGVALTVRETTEHDLGIPIVASPETAADADPPFEPTLDEATPLPVTTGESARQSHAYCTLDGLKLRILQAIRDGGPRMIMVAGAGRAVGASRTAVVLTRAIAATGARVVLVDANPDRPELAGMAAAGRFPGLSDLLRGHASFGQVIFRDRSSHAHFIAAGLSEAVDGELVESERFRQAVDALVQTYDRVVLDVGDALTGPIARKAAAYADFIALASHLGMDEIGLGRAYGELMMNAPDAELAVVDTSDVRPLDQPIAAVTTPGAEAA